MATQDQTPVPTPAPASSPAEEFFYEDKVKSPVEYLIDQFDGQKVRTWFKDEFGAKRNVELGPKLKSGRGFAKAKIVVDPSDNKTINITEEIEIQTTIDSNPAQFKVKGTEISGLFDLGLIQTGDHQLNPYVGVKVPRFGSLEQGQQNSTTTLGYLFHLARGAQYRFRNQTEFTFKRDAKTPRTEVGARCHSSFAYSRFVFSALENFNLTQYSPIQTNLSAAGIYRDAQGYAQLDLNNLTPTLFTFGAGYRVCKKLSLYTQGTQALQKGEKDEKLASPEVQFGVDYAHCPGFGVKSNINLKGKLQTAFNFNANKYFSGSLLFDTNVCKCEGKERELAWGAKVKFNC